MKLPVIKSISEFIANNDEDFVHESIELLEHISQVDKLSEDEMIVIGELLSNMYGALEVHKETKQGTPLKDAMNSFMKRVMGSIDK